MKAAFILLALLVCCICFAAGAPAEERHNVQFLKYSNDKEFEELQRQIIAQYDSLGGTSQFHEVKSASVVDPNSFKITI